MADERACLTAIAQNHFIPLDVTGFLHSTEFYVILFTAAAMIVGLLVKPRGRGQAETAFFTSTLDRDVDTTPRIEFRCLDNGDVILRRCGLHGITASATVALAMTRIGFDLEIEERVTPGNPADTPVERATFTIKGLANERYHVRYNSSAFSTFLATSLPNRPGIAFTRQFPA